MPLVPTAVGFFILAALGLFWLGRRARRGMGVHAETVDIGMAEEEVLHALGPPNEVRRLGDPLDPAFFTEKRSAIYVYEDRLQVRFEDGLVTDLSRPEALPNAIAVLARSDAGPPPGVPNPPERDAPRPAGALPRPQLSGAPATAPSDAPSSDVPSAAVPTRPPLGPEYVREEDEEDTERDSERTPVTTN